MEPEKPKTIPRLNKKEKRQHGKTLCDIINEEQAPELTKEQMKFIKDRIKRIDKGEVKLIGFDEFKRRFRKYE
ncbi:MAG: hypothetical protein IPL53_02175 [Ignavibacteria bacterium]|nr:hypothetical protein [Ignavibacteria bacterium]